MYSIFCWNWTQPNPRRARPRFTMSWSLFAFLHGINFSQVVLERYVGHLLHAEMKLCAINLYRETNDHENVVHLLSQLAMQSVTVKHRPMYMKKIYVLRALEVSKHAMDSEPACCTVNWPCPASWLIVQESKINRSSTRNFSKEQGKGETWAATCTKTADTNFCICVFPHFPWTNCSISSRMQKLLRRCAIGEKLKHITFCFSLIDSFMKVDLSMQSELLFFSKITGTVCISIVHNPWLHWQRTTVVTIVYVVRHAWSFKLSLDQSRGTYLSS